MKSKKILSIAVLGGVVVAAYYMFKKKKSQSASSPTVAAGGSTPATGGGFTASPVLIPSTSNGGVGVSPAPLIAATVKPILSTTVPTVATTAPPLTESGRQEKYNQIFTDIQRALPGAAGIDRANKVKPILKTMAYTDLATYAIIVKMAADKKPVMLNEAFALSAKYSPALLFFTS